MSNHAVIATNRFGLGAKPGELQNVDSPKRWLIKQLDVPSSSLFNDELPHSNDISKKLAEMRVLKTKFKKDNMKMSKRMENRNSSEFSMLSSIKKYPRETYRLLASASLMNSIESDTSVQWRLLDFFSNHFSVTAQGPFLTALAPTLEREAIAPHLLGNFSDILMAVCKHPAMLLYLNNERSFGDNSKLGKRDKGLNENLAREILELHTLGVNGGYNQTDVTELAKGITGWSIANPAKEKEVGFKFRVNGHEPGTRHLLGKRFTLSGLAQGESMLKYIADQKATANHLCLKLAKHFISDEPSPVLVNKLIKTWLSTSGNIKAVMVTLINSDESWEVESNKFKTPREFIVSTIRAIGLKKVKSKQLLYALKELGQQPFQADSPAGYSDAQNDWNGSSALMARIDLSSQFASRRFINSEKIIKNSFNGNVSKLTYETVMRAESRSQSAALLLMSPEFQRR